MFFKMRRTASYIIYVVHLHKLKHSLYKNKNYLPLLTAEANAITGKQSFKDFLLFVPLTQCQRVSPSFIYHFFFASFRLSLPNQL